MYGYDNVEVLDGAGRRQHVIRQVNDAQAAVVRRIFTLCAEGYGFTRIAKALNADAVPPPRHASGWAPTAVREILLRPLYRGEVIWNRIKKRDQWGGSATSTVRRRSGCGSTPRSSAWYPRTSGKPPMPGWTGPARSTTTPGAGPPLIAPGRSTS